MDHFELRRNHIEQFADNLPNDPQITATIGARCTRIEFTALTQGRVSDTRVAAGIDLNQL